MWVSGMCAYRVSVEWYVFCVGVGGVVGVFVLLVLAGCWRALGFARCSVIRFVLCVVWVMDVL